MKAKERHDIKTDKFTEIILMAEDFITSNVKTIGLVILGILAVLIIWFSTNWYFDSQSRAGAEAVNPVVKQYSAYQISNATDEERLASFKARFNEVIEKHGGTKAGTIARYYVGLINMQEGNFEEAVEEFKRVEETRQPLYWTLAAKERAMILSQQEKHADAASVFARVADSNSNDISIAYFAWMAGQSYEEAGDTNLALRYYTKAKESESVGLGSTLLNSVERRIQALGDGTD